MWRAASLSVTSDFQSIPNRSLMTSLRLCSILYARRFRQTVSPPPQKKDVSKYNYFLLSSKGPQPVCTGTQMQQDPSSISQQGLWGRSRSGIDNASPGNRFYVPPEVIEQNASSRTQKSRPFLYKRYEVKESSCSTTEYLINSQIVIL